MFMRIRSVLTNVASVVRRVLRLLARPVKGDRGQGGIVIQPYRGYGSREEVFLMGRVFQQPGVAADVGAGTIGRDIIDIGRRFLRRGVADAVVVARFGGTEQQVTTDRDGYFRVHLRPAQLPSADRLWHHMDLALVKPTDRAATAVGDVFVPPHTTRYVVISDIDDTVVYTGVANKVMMMWRLFAQGAQSRVAFPGVAALYQALYGGASGEDRNPLLYVSRGPWSIYEVLDEFFQHHGIPVGPVLFLREWGLTPQRPLPRRAKGHKLEVIRAMVALYHDLPFVLIGDSGQHDPELYTQVVREHPERILAIYIRNVSRDPARHRAIEALAKEVVAAGSSLLLAADSFAMAEHAAEHGLIAPAALAEVLKERIEQQGEPDLKATHTVERSTPQATREAVEQGAVQAALEKETGDDSPPNVVVEPTDANPSNSSQQGNT
jgi:phosphatidate phosphatase APP1